MSSSDFDSIFCRFAENIFYNPEQEIFKNQDYLQMIRRKQNTSEQSFASICPMILDTLNSIQNRKYLTPCYAR